MHGSSASSHSRLAALALAALGVVYGDIGTSPLYAMKEVFAGNHPIPLNEANVLGSLSLFFWALIVVVSLKYVAFIMRADNRGKGASWLSSPWPSMTRRATGVARRRW